MKEHKITTVKQLYDLITPENCNDISLCMTESIWFFAKLKENGAKNIDLKSINWVDDSKNEISEIRITIEPKPVSKPHNEFKSDAIEFLLWTRNYHLTNSMSAKDLYADFLKEKTK